MSWFYDPGSKQQYWLIDEERYDLKLHEAVIAPFKSDAGAPLRPFGPMDRYLGSFVWKKIDSHWMYNSFVGEEVKMSTTKLKPFPSNPNAKNLLEYLSKTNGMALDVSTTLIKHNKGVSLLRGSTTLLSWDSPDITYFWTSPNINSDELITIYERFAGKDFTFDKKTYKIKTKDTPWLHIYNGLTFEGLKLLNESDYTSAVQPYLRTTKLIDSYIDWVTPKVIAELYGAVEVGQVMPSRCHGCMVRDLRHVLLHVYRKELPFFFIVEAFRIYSAKGDGEEIDAACGLILDVKKGNSQAVDKFKELLKSFLMTCLISRKILYPVRPALYDFGWRGTHKKDAVPESTLYNSLIIGSTPEPGPAPQTQAQLDWETNWIGESPPPPVISTL